MKPPPKLPKIRDNTLALIRQLPAQRTTCTLCEHLAKGQFVIKHHESGWFVCESAEKGYCASKAAASIFPSAEISFEVRRLLPGYEDDWLVFNLANV